MRYCDLCGKKLGADELESPQTLKLQDKYFCGGCRPKVMERLQAAKQKTAPPSADVAATAKVPTAADSPARTAPAKPKTAPARPAVRQPAAQTSAPQSAQKTALKPTVPPVRPVIAGKSAGGAAAPAIPTGTAGNRQPGVVPAATSKPRAPAGGAPVAKAPLAKAPAAKSAMTRAASPVARGTVRKRPLVGASSAPATDGDADASPPEIKVRRPSKLPVFIFIGVALVGVVVLAIMMNSEKPKPVDQVAKIEGPVAPKEDPKIKLSETEYQKALAQWEKYPEDYLTALDSFYAIGKRFGDYPAGELARAKADEISGKLRAWRLSEWNIIKDKVGRLLDERKFSAAYELLEQRPKLFEGANSNDADYQAMHVEYSRLRKDAIANHEAGRHLDELKAKAVVWAQRGYVDIAEEIIRSMNTVEVYKDYEQSVPRVWDLQKEVLAQIQRDGIGSMIQSEAATETARAVAAKLKLEEEAKAREAAWLATKDSTPWVPQLGKYNLYNWVINSDFYSQDPRWRLTQAESKKEKGPAETEGVLSGQNSSGDTMYIGFFGNNWQDFVIQFDVRVLDGALELSPRTTTQPVGGQMQAPRDETSPRVEFNQEKLGRDWATVTIEVHGEKVEISILGKEGSDLRDFASEGRLPIRGGVVFYLPKDANVELRRVRTKLIAFDKRNAF
ncbi:MAG: hypothetical protein ACKVX7_01430 [Planctomycetota bacterium]